MPKKFIIYIVLIIIILAVVFLSQQAYFRGVGKTLISDATNQASVYLAEGSGWVISNIYPKINGLPAQAGKALQSGGDTIKTEVDQAKQKVTEDIGKKIENYFSGVANSVAGKNNNSCSAPETGK